MKAKKLCIVGFMASGKSTLAKALSKRLVMNMVDLDQEIERLAGMSVNEIFQSRGETVFRKMESEVLVEILDSQGDLVISCGGGTPCFENNMELIKSKSFSLYLKAEPELIISRLAHSKQKRPLVEHLEGDALASYVKTKLHERDPFYVKADLHLEAKSAKANIDEIARKIESHWR